MRMHVVRWMPVRARSLVLFLALAIVALGFAWTCAGQPVLLPGPVQARPTATPVNLARLLPGEHTVSYGHVPPSRRVHAGLACVSGPFDWLPVRIGRPVVWLHQLGRFERVLLVSCFDTEGKPQQYGYMFFPGLFGAPHARAPYPVPAYAAHRYGHI